MKLLKIEWLKMKNYTAFVAIGLIFLVCVFGVSFIAYTFNKSANYFTKQRVISHILQDKYQVLFIITTEKLVS